MHDQTQRLPATPGSLIITTDIKRYAREDNVALAKLRSFALKKYVTET
jgi:hypothetical protein